VTQRRLLGRGSETQPEIPIFGQYFLSNALGGEDIGLEEVGDAVWNIVYYSTVLGRIDLQTGKITGSENV